MCAVKLNFKQVVCKHFNFSWCIYVCGGGGRTVRLVDRWYYMISVCQIHLLHVLQNFIQCSKS